MGPGLHSAYQHWAEGVLSARHLVKMMNSISRDQLHEDLHLLLRFVRIIGQYYSLRFARKPHTGDTDVANQGEGKQPQAAEMQEEEELQEEEIQGNKDGAAADKDVGC
ncbi:hypothetical protein IAT38_003648 [Cryptococcus sp. DSM 104549]